MPIHIIDTGTQTFNGDVTISGSTRINNNLTVNGNLTATGTTTFNNTVFSVTSALSVVHVGAGPAIWVGNSGLGDIASFYDIDQNIEILHVGGNNGSFPNVGVKTSTPNVDFTVNGQISANNTIWSSSGNSNNWNNTYTNVQTNSANYILNGGNTVTAPLSVGTKSAQDLILETNSASRMVITSGGNVGIGTTTPYSKLHIAGSPALVNTTMEDILYLQRPLNAGISFGQRAVFRLGRYTTEVKSATRLDIGLRETPDDTTISTSPEVTVMTLRADRKVGINTTTPNETLTVAGNISATGTNNLLSNQQELSSTSILTRLSLDRRDQFTQTSFARLTSDDVYQLGVMEHFNDFTEIYSTGSPNTIVTTVTGSGGSAGYGNADTSSPDTLIRLPINNDKFTYRGAMQLLTSNTYNSSVFTSATPSLGQNLGAYYGSNVGWRVYITQTDSTSYIRFGGQVAMGGEFGANNYAVQRSLCFDGNVSPNFFFGAPTATGATATTRAYTVSADTGIPVLSGMWANIYMDYIPHPTSYGNLSVIDLTVAYPLSGLRYTYRFTPTDGILSNTNSSWWKKNPTGILMGQSDTRGGQIARKSMLIDWWYLKTQPLSANISYPSNWNSIRFTK